MASLLASGLIALAAAASAASGGKKSKSSKRSTASMPLPPVPDPSGLVYIPEASMSKHPGNLPSHKPILADPSTDPETANTYNWQPDAWKQKKTGDFMDSFHLYTQDTPATIRNPMNPDGLLPHFKRKLQSTNYIEPQDPYEFKPPKSEIRFEELHGDPFIAQNNVHGNGPIYLMDNRYAEMSSKDNSGSGKLDTWSLWENPKAAAMKSKMDIEMEEVEKEYFMDGVDGTGGWGGSKGITKRFEGFHPRDRLFPRKESYMSRNPQLYDYPGVVDKGVESQQIAQLGRYEVPGNADVDEYYVEPLPTASRTEMGPRIGTVVLKNQYRESTNIPYASHGGKDLNMIADAQGNRRVNPNIPPVTKKQLLTETASINRALNYQGEHLVSRNPTFNHSTRRVTPTIINEIDETLLQPYLANPYSQRITNLQYPKNLSCGKVAATESNDVPAYATA